MEWLVAPTTLPLGLVASGTPTLGHNTRGKGDLARKVRQAAQEGDPPTPKTSNRRTTPQALGQAQHLVRGPGLGAGW